ncbi:MAG TPA: ribonuclease III [Candidatus Aphodocola excrementigallinarum]|uniref:Mini-ribonuclease 3 n=1 Tax=Candidatus Aphodocola excrementigallinarum TaxID=2840670 RepID=A0A9D1IPR7_9FIRM|nr:ribonuclease III [Candidatus Aphodocola excrementigallinarum]
MDINSKVLAFIGDAVYEVMIRSYLLKMKTNDVNKLETLKVKYVSAKSQALILDDLINKNVFSENELSIIKRARNTKLSSKPKNTDIITYKKATALEALIGYLYIKKDFKRMDEIKNLIVDKGD